MSFSESQFERFVEAVTSQRKDHDTLTRMETKMDLSLNFQQQTFNQHLKDDTAEFTTIRASLSKIHARMDDFKIDVDAKFKDFFSMKDKVVGVVCFVMFLVTIAASLSTIIRNTKDSSTFLSTATAGKLVDENTVRHS